MLLGRNRAVRQNLAPRSLRSRQRLFLLMGVFVLLLVATSLLYMAGMTYLEGKPRGFWQAMDTLRDKNQLEELWQSGKAPWKVWS